MRGDVFIAETFTEMTRNAFCESAGVNEDERCLVFTDQLSEPVVNLFPNFAGHHRLQGRLRKFDGQIQTARVTTVDDCAVGCVIGIDVCVADQEARDFFDGALRGRESDANQPTGDGRPVTVDRRQQVLILIVRLGIMANQLLQTFDGEGEV